MKRETAMGVKPQQEQEQEQEQLRLESGRHLVNIFFVETLSDRSLLLLHAAAAAAAAAAPAPAPDAAPVPAPDAAPAPAPTTLQTVRKLDAYLLALWNL